MKKKGLPCIIRVIALLIACHAQADILIDQQFNSGAIPVGWTNNILQGAQGWTVRNAPAFSSTSGGFYAVFDDEVLGAATVPNEAALTTSATNCLGRTNVKLKYTHYWLGVEFTHAYVEISNDGGTVWNTLVDYEKLTRGSLLSPQDTIIDVTAYAANQSDVRVRFRYTDGSQAGRYWYLDDIRLYADPDVGVVALIEPNYLSCAVGDTLNSTDTIKIAIYNFGVDSVNNIPVTCVISGGLSATLNGTYTGYLQPGQTDTFTFTTSVDLSADNVYHFLCYTGLATDEYLGNDTLLTGRHQKIQNYSYYEQFDYSDAGWRAYGGTANRQWVHDVVPYLGGAQGNGLSWYTSVTGDLWNNFYVESPIFDFTGVTNPALAVDCKFNLSGHPSWQYVRVEYSLNNGATWTVLGSPAEPEWYNQPSYWWYGNQPNWTTYRHTLCNLIGQSCVRFRFRGYMGSGGANAYFAFDNFKIVDSTDVGVIGYVDPVDIGCLFSDQQNVTVTAYNWSCNTVYNIPAVSEISGFIADTLTGTIDSLLAGVPFNYTFPGTFDMTGLGVYNFTSYTDHPTDGDRQNDTSYTSINVNLLKISTLPYSEDFNANDGVWVEVNETVNRQWNYGSVPYLAGSPANDSAWYIQFNGDLWNDVFVESPVFDLSEYTRPTLYFDAMWNLSGHPSWQYVRVEYSLNGGASWATLGAATDPNWYNQASYWWYGNQAAWVNVQHDLCYLSGESCVKLRFRAYCGTGGTNAQFAFDNVYIDEGEGDDIEPLLLFNPDGGDCSFFGATENVGIMIKNNTCRPLTDIPVKIVMSGAGSDSIIDTIPGVLPRFGRYYHPFSSTFDMSAPGYYTFTMSLDTNYAGQGLSLIKDSTMANNTVSEIRVAQATSSFTYKADFDTSNFGWASNPLNLVNNYFNRDTVPYLGGAQGNGKSWYLDVTGNLWNNAYVESPVYDLSALTNPILYMDIKYQLSGHPSWQYARVEYSTNGGTTWTVLGAQTDPNWYNQPSYYWYGTQSSWKTVQKSLCTLAGQGCVKFRIRGYCGSAAPNSYFAFDNFIIRDSLDVGITAYIDPVDVGCLFGKQQAVTVRVFNWSCNSVSNIPVTCDVTGQVTTTLSGTVPGPIAPGTSVNYTFPGTFDMTSTGIYNFTSYSALAGDGYAGNDTLRTTINVNQLKVVNYPYFENFDTSAGYWVESNETVNRQWIHGAVPYLAGPAGNDTSWYLSFTGDLWNNVYIESPVLDLSEVTNPTFSMDAMWNLSGHPSWQYVRVEYSINGGATWNILGSQADPNWYNQPSYWWYGNQPTWKNVSHDLCVLSGESCAKIRINAYCGTGGANAYFAFDNVMITGGRGDDLEPLLIFGPDGADCAGFNGAEAVGVLIQNNTCRALTNIPVSLNMTGAGTATILDTIPGPINRFSRYYHTFGSTLDMSTPGDYYIEVGIDSDTGALSNSYIRDTVPANDTIVEVRYFNAISTFPYFADFDTSNYGFASSPLSAVNRVFLRDTLPYLNGAEGNGKSWYFDVSGDLWNNSYVESPVFDFSAVTSPMLSMDIKHQLSGHPSWQYARVEYSVNGGSTWTVLGAQTDPDWYNQPSYYWYGTNTVWTNVQHTLCMLIGQSCVKFRVRGYVGSAGANARFAFDNFRIFDAQDVGVTAYIAPTQDGCLYSDSTQVTVRLYNWSCSSVSGIPIRCDVTGANTATLVDTVLGAVAASGFIDATFPQYFDMTSIGSYNFTAYTDMPAELNRTNDTASMTRIVEHLKIDTLDHFEDFNATTGFGDWVVRGATANRNWFWGTVPYLGGAQGRGNSWYLQYTGDLWSDVYLESPVYDFTNVLNPMLTFEEKHNLSGHPSWQYVRVEYSLNGGSTWTVLGAATDPLWYNQPSYWWYGNRPNWTLVQHNLCALAGQSCVMFRMRGYCGSGGANAQFAFDNWHITDTPLDAELVSVTGCYGSSYDIEVTVRNVSLPCTATPAITNLDLTYTIDGGAQTTLSYSGLNIAGNGTDVLIIPNQTVPTDSSTVLVWATIPNALRDQQFENDTAKSNIALWPNCNDHCSNAIDLGLGTTTASQTSNGTAAPEEDPAYSSCGVITVENTVWYKFTTNSTGDSVAVRFENQVCAPSSNGIQISIDSLSGPACDTANYNNVYCSAINDTAAVQFGPVILPANTVFYIAIDGFAGNDCNFDITISGAVAPLPVNQIEFYASLLDLNSARLMWEVSEPDKIQYYTVQRSLSGTDFKNIAQVKSRGISSEYVDKQLAAGTYYYRIAMRLKNGMVRYSTVRLVTVEGEYGTIELYPNPTSGTIHVKINNKKDAEQLLIEMKDIYGRIVFVEVVNLKEGDNDYQFGVQNLSNGTYVANIYIDDRKVFYKKVVKME